MSQCYSEGERQFHEISCKLSWAIGVASLIILASTIGLVWPFTVDDAYIALRYSAHLAAGQGPNYNTQPQRSEGYTSFLWIVLMAVPHLFKVDAVIFAKVVGIISTLLLLLISFAFVRELCSSIEGFSRSLSASIVVFMLTVFYPTAIHSISGMETSLCALLLVSFIYFTVVNIREPFDLGILSPLLGILLGLTRPETNLIVAPTLFFHLLSTPRKNRKNFVLGVGFLYIFPGAVYYLWRATYYGHLFPLPFYVKTLTREFMAGKYATLEFFEYMFVRVGLLVGIGCMRWNKGIILTLSAAGVLILFFLFPASIMNYDWRYNFPAVSLILSAAAFGFHVLLSSLKPLFINEKGECSRLRFYGLISGICLVIAVGFLKGARSSIADKRSYSAGMSSAHVKLGKILGEINKADEKPMLAIADAGAVPYYSGWRTIDTFGLNDPIIALQDRRDPQYVLSQNPTLVVLISFCEEKFDAHLPWEALLYEECIRAGMVRLETMTFRKKYYLWVMGFPKSEVAVYLGKKPDPQ